MKNKIVAIGQFDGSTKLLKLDIKTNEYEVIESKNISLDQTAFGVFELELSTLDTIAVLATPEGPVLFLNGLKFQPNLVKTKIFVNDDKNLSHFQIFHDGQLVFDLFYKEKFGIGLHPYASNREDIDIYYWLAKIINNPKFYKTYTKEINFFVSIESGLRP